MTSYPKHNLLWSRWDFQHVTVAMYRSRNESAFARLKTRSFSWSYLVNLTCCFAAQASGLRSVHDSRFGLYDRRRQQTVFVGYFSSASFRIGCCYLHCEIINSHMTLTLHVCKRCCVSSSCFVLLRTCVCGVFFAVSACDHSACCRCLLIEEGL